MSLETLIYSQLVRSTSKNVGLQLASAVCVSEDGDSLVGPSPYLLVDSVRI